MEGNEWNTNFILATLGLTDDQKEFLEVAKNFADNEMLPHAAKWDEEQFFPRDVCFGILMFGY